MTEEYLHYAWKYRMFENPISTSKGERLLIIEPGEHNTDSGPDFFNARVVIGNTKWAGNVEIHVSSSDWYKHRHQEDEVYESVILHVVYHNDKVVTRGNGLEIPVFEVKNYLKSRSYKLYKYLLRSRAGIPCQDMTGLVDDIHLADWKVSLVASRIIRKVGRLERFAAENNDDLEKGMLILLFRVFGSRVNTMPFEMLAKSIPVRALRQCRMDILSMEALLFGQSGMLEETFCDKYPLLLKKEYDYLRNKFNLEPINRHIWKYHRLRPSNFPTMRIAQLAALISCNNILGFEQLETYKYGQIKSKFGVTAGSYWQDHFLFDRRSKRHSASVGTQLIDNLIINFFIPAAVLRDRLSGKDVNFEACMSLLQELNPEKNSITRYFDEIHMDVHNAADSQAYIELKNVYCDFKRCLSCRIGHLILKRSC